MEVSVAVRDRLKKEMSVSGINWNTEAVMARYRALKAGGLDGLAASRVVRFEFCGDIPDPRLSHPNVSEGNVPPSMSHPCVTCGREKGYTGTECYACRKARGRRG